MNYRTIEYRQDGPVGLLILNRPQCLNAVNFTMREEIYDFLKARLNDTETRVLVITGAGRGFCAGLDMKDPNVIPSPENVFTPEKAYRLQSGWSEMIVLMRRIPQPIVGAINGAAAGAGLSFALACDVRYAAPEARFSAAYINIGVGGADMGSSWLLPRIVGTGDAARWLMTGDLFGAEEAYRIGLVQSIVDKDKLMDEALALADNMAGKSPLGLRLTKEAIDRNTGGMSLEDAIRLEDRNQAMCIAQISTQIK
jgi:enoyl-CoA hydratase